MDNLNLYIPITKVDEAKRLVYGVATAELEDRSGEICDYASTKPFYEKWSGDIAKTTDGKSLGNLRAMHGKVAAGKLTAINFDDDNKRIEICAKVVDDDEWVKVTEGVYTGFSQGGKYVKRWKDEAGVQRYTADPSEVSLVDLPCLPSATFELIKADGAAETRGFKMAHISNDDVAKKATELAKAAGDETKWASFVDQARAELEKAVGALEGQAGEGNGGARDPAAAVTGEPEQAPVADVTKSAAPTPAGAPNESEEWEQVWKSKRDGKTFKTKAELRKYHDDLDAAAKVAPATAPVLEALSDIAEKLGVEKRTFTADERKKAAESGAAMKDGSFPIENREDLENAVRAYGRAKNKSAAKRHIIKRAKALGATDLLPEDWRASTKAKKAAGADGGTELEKGAASLWTVSNLINLLAYIENAEDALEVDPSLVYGGAVDVPKELTDRFGAILVEFGDLCADVLDVVLESISKEEREEALAAAAPTGALHKRAAAVTVTVDAETVQKVVTEAIEPLAKRVDEIGAERDAAVAERDALKKSIDNDIMPMLKRILAQPVPVHLAGTRTVEKGREASAEPETIEQQLAKMSPEEKSLLFIKLAQQNPQPILSRG